MLDWFKKNETPAAGSTDSAAKEPVAAGAAAPDKATPIAVDWQPRLLAAAGDDTALLALAREAPAIDVKMAAIEALVSEAALKLAEREYRDHDRRVHRLAKQRHLSFVARRENREQAGRLIDAAKELVKEPLIAANRLVDLDRAWQALDSTLLADEQRDEFGALLAQLAALTRERADRKLIVDRWTADARLALTRLQASCAAADAGTQDRDQLAAAIAAASAALEGAPEDDRCAALRDALRVALDEGAQLGERLAARADQQAQDQAQQALRTEQRERALDRKRDAKTQRTEALEAALTHAEAALAAGHLADTNKHLVEIDELLHGGTPAAALRARIDTLQAEYARLKGWQHWGGGLARDDLVLQAEALAAASRGEAPARIVKLSVKQQAEVIDDLRARWKELDRLGGATSRSLWQRFDAALKAAYEPVAAHLDVQRAARQQNLQARRQLVEALNAMVLPEASEGGPTPDWKALAAALEHFQTEWRKLGPVEHTVPHKERDKLLEAMRAAVQRLDTPLAEVRRAAQLVRERLIARARTLASEASIGAQGRDTTMKVRELQSEWQQHAKALPLARQVENALWAEFKGAVDAIFSARDAAFNARDAQFKTHGAERAALIERLAGLSPDTPPAELKRTLADVDAQWQRAGPAPRNDAAALDAGFRNARDAVRQWLAGSAQRSWHAHCDALFDKLAQCEASSPALDDAQAKEARATDDLLLQLEIAFQLESPPAFQAARRELKLKAMKAALESRQKPTAPSLPPDQLLAAALARPALDEVQRERLHQVIAAMRVRGPNAG